MGTVAFANALAAIAVFPLAPFIAADLRVSAQATALTSMAFAVMAGVGGLAGALLLGGVTLRCIIKLTLAGAALGLLLSGLATSFNMLLAARAITGLSSGPLLAAVFAAVPGAVPQGRRNSALASVVGAYGLALVLGLPSVLLLAIAPGGWRTAFVVLAGLCGLLFFTDARFGAAPPQEEATSCVVASIGMWRLLAQGQNRIGLGLIATASFGTLLISPHLGTFALRNTGLSNFELWYVYVVGGALALAATRATGQSMNRIGAVATSVVVAVVLTTLLALSFAGLDWQEPTMVSATVLGALLAAQLARSAVAQASAAQIVEPPDRLVYQCLVSTCTSLAQAAGAGCSALLLSETGDGRLIGMPPLAFLSAITAWSAPFLLLALRRQQAAMVSTDAC